MSISYTFDPARGEAVRTDPRASMGDVDPTLPTLEQKEEAIHQTMAKGLSERARGVSSAAPGEDASNLKMEEKLLDLQAQISREQNPLKLEQMMLLAEQMAGSLVGGEAPTPVKEPGAPTAAELREEWHQNYRNQHPDVDAALENAASLMGDDLASSFNEMLDSDDEMVRVGAIETVRHLHNSPDSFMSVEDSPGVSAEFEREIALDVGDELAHSIAVLGNSLQQKLITPQQAIQTASRDPRILQALVSLSKSNPNFRIAL